MNIKGKVIGKIFRRDLMGSKHRMRIIPGWGMDVTIIAELESRGVEAVEVLDTETKTLYLTKLANFANHGVLKDFGYGEQRILPDKWWVIDKELNNGRE